MLCGQCNLILVWYMFALDESQLWSCIVVLTSAVVHLLGVERIEQGTRVSKQVSRSLKPPHSPFLHFKNTITVSHCVYSVKEKYRHECQVSNTP